MTDRDEAEKWVLDNGNSSSDMAKVKAHLAGQQHGAQKEKERIWAKYKQREAQGYNAPLDLRQIIFNEGV